MARVPPARPQRQGLLQLQLADPGHGPALSPPQSRGPKEGQAGPAAANQGGACRPREQAPAAGLGGTESLVRVGPRAGRGEGGVAGVPGAERGGEVTLPSQCRAAGLREPAGGGAGSPGRLSLRPRPAAGGGTGASGSRSWFGSGGTRSPGLGLGRTEAELASETWPVLGQWGWKGAVGVRAALRGGVGGPGTQWLVGCRGRVVLG